MAGCDTSPCTIVKGSTLNAEWDFILSNDVKNLFPRVKATVGGITIPYPYPEQDACKSLVKGNCPLKKDDEATYSLRMPIDKNIPSLALKIEFALVDRKKKPYVCFSVNAKVTS